MSWHLPIALGPTIQKCKHWSPRRCPGPRSSGPGGCPQLPPSLIDSVRGHVPFSPAPHITSFQRLCFHTTCFSTSSQRVFEKPIPCAEKSHLWGHLGLCPFFLPELPEEKQSRGMYGEEDKTRQVCACTYIKMCVCVYARSLVQGSPPAGDRAPVTWLLKVTCSHVPSESLRQGGDAGVTARGDNDVVEVLSVLEYVSGRGILK